MEEESYNSVEHHDIKSSILHHLKLRLDTITFFMTLPMLQDEDHEVFTQRIRYESEDLHIYLYMVTCSDGFLSLPADERKAFYEFLDQYYAIVH